LWNRCYQVVNSFDGWSHESVDRSSYRLQSRLTRASSLCFDVAHEDSCEWRRVGEGAPSQDCAPFPRAWFSSNLDSTRTAEGIYQNATRPFLPCMTRRVQILAKKFVLLVGNPAANALILGSTFDQ
jgi:hypothetical protein